MKKVYIVAIIVALMVGVATYMFTTSLANNTKVENAETVNVLVATQDIPAGTMITTEMEATHFTIKNVLKTDETPEAVNSIAEIMGQVIAQDLYAGEQISMKRIVAQGGDDAGLSYNLLEGEVAYSIRAEEERGVDGYILPGDTIDIVVGALAQVGEGQLVKSLNDYLNLGNSEILFQNLEVLKVAKYQEVSDAKDNEAGDGEVKTYTSVTLRVTEEIAKELMKMEVAIESNRIKFILNSRVDAEAAKEEWANRAK